MGDRVVVLDRGRIRQFDTPETTYNQPVSPEVARILNCYNLFSGHLAGASFYAPEGDLPVARVGAASGTPAYAIRRDLIAIEPAGTASSRDTAALEAAFVTSEYSGSAIMYFFELPGGKIVEVEHHLSHRAPETLEPRRNYSLVWRADDAVVFG
jgi:putative spermidine/putrescine transport system ATP-binding protein